MKKKSLVENLSDTNSAIVELLITDAKTALTLLDLAETTKITEDRSRRIGEAHLAYRTIVSTVGRLNPTADQAQTLRTKMRTLKARLRAAGVSIE